MNKIKDEEFYVITFFTVLNKIFLVFYRETKLRKSKKEREKKMMNEEWLNKGLKTREWRYCNGVFITPSLQWALNNISNWISHYIVTIGRQFAVLRVTVKMRTENKRNDEYRWQASGNSDDDDHHHHQRSIN